jgi:hypothetical protein
VEGLDAVAEALGIELLAHHEDDPLFRRVRLPEGWGFRYTDHSMWTDLVDDNGKKRAGIFYKAAFYDRRASIQLDVEHG